MLTPEETVVRTPVQTLEEMQAEVYEVNQSKGWFDSDRTFGDDIALLHTEVSEMFEAFRDFGLNDGTEVSCQKHDHSHPMTEQQLADSPCKPEGVGSEVADVLIRLLDTCQRRGIDLRTEYVRKIAYNRTRSYKHGGRTI